MTLEQLKKEYNEILNQLQDPELISNWERLEELSKKKAYLEKIIEKEEELQEINRRIQENQEIIKGEEDRELSLLAEEELKSLLARKESLKKEIERLLKKDEDSEKNSVIVEIRAGTGGEEAALFAADLFRMYSKYANSRNWKQRILDASPTDLGGYKQIVFEISGNEVWENLKYEAGVHRVQRIPVTEKSGRIHTSTASVAVLLKPKKTQITIKPEDLKIEVFRASGPGGQYVNKRETAVRITHIPTGIVVSSQSERSQLQNKENALAILAAKILEKKEEEAQAKIGNIRKTQIGQAKRAEKIRTYNFPQDRVTDHRIKKTFHNIEAILSGEIEEIIKALKEADKKNQELGV